MMNTESDVRGQRANAVVLDTLSDATEVRKEVAKKPKTVERQRKNMRKALMQHVEKNVRFSEALLQELQKPIDKYFWHVYGDKDCNDCYGRGVNEISHGNQARVVPCDCAIKNRQKDDGVESTPIYGVTNDKGSFLYYQRRKDQKFFVPSGWEKAERVLIG